MKKGSELTMCIAELKRVIEIPDNPRFVITPVTKCILGVYPNSGHFISLALNDPRLNQIEREEIQQIRILDNMVYLDI